MKVVNKVPDIIKNHFYYQTVSESSFKIFEKCILNNNWITAIPLREQRFETDRKCFLPSSQLKCIKQNIWILIAIWAMIFNTCSVKYIHSKNTNKRIFHIT